MSTGRDIIQAMFEMIGVYAPGQPVLDADAERGLDQVNKMLDIWSNESLATFAILEQSAVLTVAKTAYTIGKTGTRDIDKTRPLRILEGPGAAYLQDTNSNNYAVDVVPQDEWNQIANRGVTVVSNIPSKLFYDPQYPLGIINIWPAPTAAYTLFWDSYLQLGSLTLSGNLSFPPGYEAAIQSNGAVWIAPFFKNALVSEDVKALAIYTKKIIKRTNKRTNRAQIDPALLVGSARGLYNVWTDSMGNTGR